MLITSTNQQLYNTSRIDFKQSSIAFSSNRNLFLVLAEPLVTMSCVLTEKSVFNLYEKNNQKI